MRKILLGIMAMCALFSRAVTLDEVEFHNEASDTAKITQILVDAAKIDNANERVGAIARSFIGTPYVAHTLEGEKELLRVNLDELDCTTFVETVMALAYTAGENRTSWRDYIYNLERIRYRGGRLNGYASRLHYISDWIMDNSYRGNFVEVTNRLPECRYLVKTIDFMSANRKSYPALADDEVYRKIKDVEMGYRSHRFPYIKSSNLTGKAVKGALKDGDIVALTCDIKNLDVSHMGIIVVKDDEPYLLHASSSHGKVEISDIPLCDFMKRNFHLTGIRVIRFE